MKYKNIKEICREIDLIIEKKDNKNDYKYLYSDMINALQKKIDYSEIVIFCNTVLLIAKTKNRILRYLEKDFWDFINKMPFQLLLIQRIEISKNEIIESNTDYDNQGKKILSRLIGLDEIIKNTDDRTVASTCLQIQINAGIIDEIIAVHEMDDWKDDHFYYHKEKNINFERII